MKNWLEGNPLGVALATLSGLLLLGSLALGMTWNLPPSSAGAIEAEVETDPVALPRQIEPMQPLENYAVVLERPVFNESRRPEDDPNGDQDPTLEPEVPESVADPGVRLTGVVLTPDERIVTLTPTNSGDPLIVREGTELEGEQLGWTVSSIDARKVSLSSRDGQELQLDLVIHDQMIEEPPKPEPEPMTSEEALAAEGEGEGQPLSRAEEIRQRIQERREQLRREAEEAEGETADAKEEQKTSYQDAIRAMMSRKNNESEQESGEDDQE